MAFRKKSVYLQQKAPSRKTATEHIINKLNINDMKIGIKTTLILGLLLACCGTAMAQYGPGGYGRRGPGYRSYRSQPPAYGPRGYNNYAYSGPQFLDITEFGYVFSVDDEFEKAGHLTFHEAALLMFTPRFGLGVGVGTNYFVEADLYNVPLYGMGRIAFGASMLDLYIECRVGYSLGNVSGFYLMPSLGLRLGYESAFTLSLGYQIQKFSEVNNSGIDVTYTLNGLSLRVGYEL